MGERYPTFRRVQSESGPYRRRPLPPARGRTSRPFWLDLALGCTFVAAVSWVAAPQITAVWVHATSTEEANTARERSAFYKGCREARDAGVTPIYRGQPGYRAEMDGDNDGIACEDY